MEELAEFFQPKTVKSGETLWEEGDACDYLAIINSGRVEVKKNTEFKGKHVIVGIYSQGTVVGALCILDGSPRAVTAVALEDVSLMIITQEDFDRLIEQKPEIGIKLLKGILLSVSIRLRKSFERLARFF
jgi:CRP-like cAMP-binding protein